MKTVTDIAREFRAIVGLRIGRDEKVLKVFSLKKYISEIEMAAARDLSFPLQEIVKAKTLLMEIERYLK